MTTGPSDADPTAVLAAFWNESERRLYPMATSNPDAYQSGVRLARAVADALATVQDLDELAQRWEARLDTLEAASHQLGATAAHGLVDETLGAGFALRRRELLNELAERRRLQRIAAARRDGLAWALVHEQGDLDSGLANPYQCVEVHLRTGLAVVSMVEPDPSTMAPVYVVTVTAMGDEHGAAPKVDSAGDSSGLHAADLSAAGLDDLETSDPQKFEHHRQQMRDRVEALSS